MASRGGLRRARQRDGLRVQGAILNVLENEPLGRLFSLRQDFSTAFSRLVHSPEGTAVELEITDRHFPAVLVGRDLAIDSATLVVRTSDDAGTGGLSISLNDTPITGFTADATFGGLRAKTAGTALAAGIVATHTIEIGDAGDLAPEAPVPGDDSALDDRKIADILIYVEVRVA